MGLNAFVRCRCFEEGKCAPPPAFVDRVVIDEEDFAHPVPKWEGADQFQTFQAWLETCCAHPRMHAANERISNWGGLRRFQDQLAELGIDQFPTLRDVLPAGNGGSVSPAQSAAALRELDDFVRRDPGSKVVLMDADSGQEIAEFVAAYRGLFIFSPDGFEAGVDPCGFFILGPSSLRSALSRLLGARKGIRERVVHNAAGYVISLPARDPISRVRVWLIDRILRDPKFELFRSSRFRQERLAERNFRFTDERSGRSFRAPFGLPRPPAHEPSPSTAAPEYPLSLTVERHKRGTGAFDYILKPLRRVFETSVQIDRPVQWS